MRECAGHETIMRQSQSVAHKHAEHRRQTYILAVGVANLWRRLHSVIPSEARNLRGWFCSEF